MRPIRYYFISIFCVTIASSRCYHISCRYLDDIFSFNLTKLYFDMFCTIFRLKWLNLCLRYHLTLPIIGTRLYLELMKQSWIRFPQWLIMTVSFVLIPIGRKKDFSLQLKMPMIQVQFCLDSNEF